MCVNAEYNIIADANILSRPLRASQNPTTMIVAKIKKDANTSGIKKLIKNETGVATNIADVTHTNVENDNRKHLIVSV